MCLRVNYDAIGGLCVVREFADEVAFIFELFEDGEFRNRSLLVELVIGELSIHFISEQSESRRVLKTVYKI